jgi:hypothetical protein
MIKNVTRLEETLELESRREPKELACLMRAQLTSSVSSDSQRFQSLASGVGASGKIIG